MNSRKAKEVLILFRPGTADRDEAEFSEALDLAGRDPELGRWFENHCALQEALRAKFKQIPVPEGLKEQILSERKVRLEPSPARKWIWATAAAFGVVVLIAGAFYFASPRGEDKTFTGFRNRMASLILRQYPKRMDLETSDLNAIHDYLAQKGRGGYVLPQALEQTPGTGCLVTTWQGNPVTMVCFNSGTNGKPKEPDVFLFVIDRKAVPKAPAPSGKDAVFTQIGKMATLSWSKDKNVYLLGGLGDETFVRKFL